MSTQVSLRQGSRNIRVKEDGRAEAEISDVAMSQGKWWLLETEKGKATHSLLESPE